jgi:hypothetical protein
MSNTLFTSTKQLQHEPGGTPHSPAARLSRLLSWGAQKEQKRNKQKGRKSEGGHFISCFHQRSQHSLAIGYSSTSNININSSLLWDY